MLHKFRFVIAGLIIILVNQAVTFAVSARMPNALRPAGTTRYAMAQSDAQLYVGPVAAWQPSGLATSVTIPAGKTADVTVLFCSEGYAAGNAIFARAKIGAALLAPNSAGSGVRLIAGTNNLESHCVNFYRAAVSDGTKTVKVEWSATHVSAYLQDRSMIVILNIR